MQQEFSLQQQYHNLALSASGKGIHHSVSYTNTNRYDNNNTNNNYINRKMTMTMKQPRDNSSYCTEPSLLLLGSDHREKLVHRNILIAVVLVPSTLTTRIAAAETTASATVLA